MKRRDFLNQSLLVASGTAVLGLQRGEALAPLPNATASTVADVARDLRWSRFLAAHDMIWERLPAHWWEAPFIGNGLMGTQIRQDAPQSVRFDIGRSDVQEHRKVQGIGGEGGFNELWANSRLPIGFFSLQTEGKISGGTLRLDLWNAETHGEIVTERGKIEFRALIHADAMILRVEIEKSAGESGARLEWHALEAICPRANFKPLPAGYEKNPLPQSGQSGEVQWCLQPLLAGGETATAWHQRDAANQTVLLVSVAHSYPDQTSTREAVETVNRARAQNEADFVASHRAWWHRFYPASFLSLPNAYWESFYWIQLYKLASATRADRALIDNQGPWLQDTPWPAAWWNLNVQLTYWPTLQANHAELAESLFGRMDKYVGNLILNVAPQYRADSAAIFRSSGQELIAPVSGPKKGGKAETETGDLLWTLNNYWQMVRITMDEKRTRQQFFPLLRRATSFYLHFLEADAQGVLHLPDTFSPEYGAGPDCTYDLGLLRWGLHTLLKCDKRFDINDPDRAKWRQTLEKLVPYPTDKNGYMIAATLPFNRGHRHFSHLLQVFPLHLVNRNQPGAWELVDKSVRHWHSMGGRQGYSFTGAALMMTSFGEGNRALEYLDGLRPLIQRNTLYKEAGPVIETPLSAAHVLQQMLLQSWAGPEEETGVVRVFPAMPDAWADATYENMRAEGGFVVSAAREGGQTRWVRIQSLAGEPCRISPSLQGEVKVSGSRRVKLRVESDGLYQLDLPKGAEVVLYSGTKVPSTVTAPLQNAASKTNLWGLKAV